MPLRTPPQRRTTRSSVAASPPPSTSSSETISLADDDEVQSVQSFSSETTETRSRSTPRRRSKRYPLRSNSRGLPLHIQKQLLQDIEAAGGLTAAKLANICNRRSDIYGTPASTRRSQIQQKVKRLKLLSREEYLILLTEHRIFPSELKADTPLTRTPSRSQQPQPSPLPSSPLSQERVAQQKITMDHHSRMSGALETRKSSLFE